jgi:hypothetical protein
MKKTSFINTASKLALFSAVGLLVACSSGSDDPVDASISGTIFAAAVSGADVLVTDGTNTVAGPVKTDTDGKYTLVIPHGSLNQGLYIKSSGGSFKDEATKNPGTAGEMLAYKAAIKNGDSVSVTPGSTIIANLVAKGGKTLAEAQEAFANAFGYTPNTSITPLNATVAPAADASEEAKLAGLRAAAFSQLAMDLGLSQDNQFDLFVALAKDLSDGVLNGIDASGSVDIGSTGFMLEANIQNRFTTALLNFHNTGLMGDTFGSDQTGLTSDQIGSVPFAGVTLTNTYKIQYVPGAMKAMEGKTEFQLRITDKNSADVASGLTVTMMPMMHMAAHEHSSAMGDCTEIGTTGVYDCTVYYVMASVMSSGASMGYWTLKVMAGGMNESATFYPLVMMAMGDTTMVKLRGQSGDMVPGMTTPEMKRTYLLFKDGFSGMGDNRTFNLYIATRENMMSYPAVYAGTTLNECAVDSDTCKTAHQLIVNTMTVEVSTDAATWFAADGSSNDGKWSVSDLPGLVDGTEGKIYARITINDEVKTTDGMAPAVVNDVDNGYATFTITPGGM